MSRSLVALCREAWPKLDAQQPLDDKASFKELYVAREDRKMDELQLRLELGALANRRKLVFSGHRGSGKSTELYRLKRTLEEGPDRVTAIYFRVQDHVSMVGLDATRLLEAMSRAIWSSFPEDHRPFDKEDLEERIRQAYEALRRVRRHTEILKLSAGIGPKFGVAAGNVTLSSDRGRTEERTLELAPDPSEMLSLTNELLESIRRSRRDPRLSILLLCDDLEKIDLNTAISVFADGLTLAAVDAAVIYTAPIALLYSEAARPLLGHFDDEETVLPIIQVVDRAGREDEHGIGRLREIILPRFPELERLLTERAFREIAVSSGGVVRDLIRMVRDLCLTSITTKRESPFTESEVGRAKGDIRTQFLRQVPRELLPRLHEVGTTGRRLGMDTGLARLLNLAAVLEYANGERWYRIHPLAEHLLEIGDADPS